MFKRSVVAAGVRAFITDSKHAQNLIGQQMNSQCFSAVNFWKDSMDAEVENSINGTINGRSRMN